MIPAVCVAPVSHRTRLTASICGLLLGLPMFLAQSTAAATDRLDPRDRDTRAAVCDDAYRFANGGWLDRTAVPAGHTRWNRFIELAELARIQRLQLLDALRASPADSADPLVIFLRSFDDETLLAASVDQALAALLPAVDQVQKPAQAAELLRALEARGVPVLFEVDRGSRSVTLRGHVLALSDPAFYTDERDAARQLLGNYRAYVESLLTVAGAQAVREDSAWVLDFEMKLARAMRAQLDLSVQVRELDQRMPRLGWSELIKALGGKSGDRVILTQPALFEALDRLLAEAPAVQWRAWLRFRIVHALAADADERLRGPYEALFASTLGAADAFDDPALRSLHAVESWFRPELAQRFTLEHVQPAQLLAVTAMFDALRMALLARIDARTDWPESERRSLRERVQGMRLAGLEPSDARDLSALQLSAQNRIGNLLAVRRWQRQRTLRGKESPAAAPIAPLIRYDTVRAVVEVAPAALQPPLFDAGADSPVRFGGLGVLLARELLRGTFEVRADARQSLPTVRAQWDAAAASLASAWPPDTHAAPAELGQALLLDRAALELARTAWAASNDPASAPVDGHNATQRYFLGWASLWRENRRPPTPADRDTSAQRANFALGTDAAFVRAFQCKPDNAMLRTDPASLPVWP